MSKTQLRGPQRLGASALDEGALTVGVVGSYAAATTEEAQAGGQSAAAAVLPIRRSLWRLAEQLCPERLAATLRVRASAADPTGRGRDGIRELRLAIADWLDPPPVCRWCRQAIRSEDDGRVCRAPRRPYRSRTRSVSPCLWPDGEPVALKAAAAAKPPRPRKCKPMAPLSPLGRCGTLALYSAGQVSLEIMAAALACPKGAASGYDVAADRDAKALLAATTEKPPRDPAEESAWSDKLLRLLHAAVQAADARRPRPLHPSLIETRRQLDDAREQNLKVNGRIGLAVQLRYYAPRDGVTRADLVQGAVTGLDRAALDYDAAKAKYSTYAGDWARQGCGEVWDDRDVVGTPTWVTDLRRAIEERLHVHGPDAVRDLLRAIEALAEAPLSSAAAQDLADILAVAEVIDSVPAGPKQPRRRRRQLFPGAAGGDADALADLAEEAMLAARRPPPKKKPKAGTALPPEEPERVRERIAVWVAERLELGDESGSGVLAALRHGAPVLVQIGSGGGDGEDESEAQGLGDGAGGSERAAAILGAPDELEVEELEAEARLRWQAALSALAALRNSRAGREAAEVIRRHHGLDGMDEDRSGAGGESFASIAERGLVCSGRHLSKEALRKIYLRGMERLRQVVAGQAPADLFEDDDVAPPSRPRVEPLRPAEVVTMVSRAPPAAPSDGRAWEAFREEASSVMW